MLAQAIATANPIDDLLELAERLHTFEQQYGMASAEFYQRYQSGSLNDGLAHALEWAAMYRLFLQTRRALEATLMRAAIQGDVSEAAA